MPHAKQRRSHIRKKQKRQGKVRKWAPRVLTGTFQHYNSPAKAIVSGKVIPVHLQPIDPLRGDPFLKRPPWAGTKGTIGFHFDQVDGRKVMFLSTVYVPFSERMKGNAEKLVRKALETAGKKGAAEVRVVTGREPGYAGMRRVLEKLGFEEAPMHSQGPEARVVRYVKGIPGKK